MMRVGNHTRARRTTGAQQRTARSGEINHALVDRFTLGHAAAGVLVALGRVPPGWAIAIAVGWELLERPLKNQFPDVFPHGTQDTLQNAVLDAAALLGAYALVRVVFRTSS